MDFKGKKVLVFGAGKSGIGACSLLTKLGAKPVLYDSNAKADRDAIRARLGSSCNETEIILGDLPEEILDSLDLVVMSPGVPLDIPPVEAMKAKGIRIWGEVELAYRAGAGKVLAVTGTNGKTTTVSLLGKIMSDYYPEVFVVGNIGNPYTEASLSMTEKSWTAAEISSFQLETIEAFHPLGSAITNITEDHLNRHHTMAEYIRVKERIAENQTGSDFCVLNYEDPVLREFAGKVSCRVVFFSGLRRLKEGLYLENGTIYLAENGQTVPVVRTEELQILGRHNYENVMTAAGLAYYAGVPVENIRKSAMEFKGVAHRIEFVLEKDGVRYYNDSKGTNPDAAIKGIQAMNRPTLLIGGGFDKESSYDEWINSFDGKVKFFALIGQTKEKIRDAAVKCGFPEERIAFFDNLEEAVKGCHAKAAAGDAVLLSPACASWGQFDNYEQRGDMFKAYVRAL
ncbi:MAG: UDP-N-acetylmuramoyl-L-alanine--D-glutamate ligase [Eubacterium sp.]|nr:UDP-N-acetylmuramoyl-L-alanine--D-glutamate ligase [Eubacterium sp.]